MAQRSVSRSQAEDTDCANRARRQHHFGGASAGPAKLAAAGLFSALALSLAGCGHPATPEECDEIFNKSAEIELRMQNVTDPKVIEERTAAVRKDRGEELVRQCIGKRITDEAMGCVRKAKTSQEMDQCLD